MKLFLSLFFFSAAHAFVAPNTVMRSSSSLRMVADDAKVVLVTGSSRGLGKSIALDIGKAGQKVVINYVSDGSKESADETVAEIKAAGGDAIAIQADCKSLLFSLACFRQTANANFCGRHS